MMSRGLSISGVTWRAGRNRKFMIVLEHAAGLALSLALAMMCAPAPAQVKEWKPDRNVELLVGTSAGSSLDRTARTVQRLWQEQRILDVSSTIVNKPGGNMSVAAAVLAQHPGDAHYLQLVSPTLLTTHILTGGYNYTDFTPLAILGRQYLAIAAPADSPIRSGRDLMAKLKADPASVTFGLNGGAGNNLHILIAVLGKAAGADVRKLKVAVFQGGELMTAALGHHVDLISTVASNIVPHVEAGKLRIIGVAAPQRLPGAFAQVPTWREPGVDAVVVNWAAVLGTKGLTPEQIAYWDRVFARTTGTDAWQKDMAKNYWDASLLNAADTSAYLKSDYAKLSGALAELGLARKQ